MAPWFESQIETRRRLDSELLDRSYAELAASVSDPRDVPVFHASDLEAADGAVRTCLRYCGVVPPEASGTMDDLEERIEWLCRPTGAMHRNVRLEGQWYRDAFGAILGMLDGEEPVALLPAALGGYCYFDSATGRKRKVDAAIAARIAEDAVLFYRPFPQGELSVRDLLLFLVRLLDRSDYIFVITAALATTLVGLLPAWANQLVFSTVIPSGQASLIAPICALLLGVSISTALLGICRNLVMSRISTKLSIATEAATFSRVLLLPPSFFKDRSSGELASRVSQVSMLMQLLTSIFLGSGLTVALSLVYIAQISAFAPMLAMPALGIVALQAVLTIISMRFSAASRRSSSPAPRTARSPSGRTATPTTRAACTTSPSSSSRCPSSWRSSQCSGPSPSTISRRARSFPWPTTWHSTWLTARSPAPSRASRSSPARPPR